MNLSLLQTAEKSYQVGEYIQAAQLYFQDLEQNPSHLSNFWYAGLCFLLSGQPDEAQFLPLY